MVKGSGDLSFSFEPARTDTHIGGMKVELADIVGRIISPVYSTRYLVVQQTPQGVWTIRLATHEDVWEASEPTLLPNRTLVRVIGDWELQTFLRVNHQRLAPVLKAYPQIASILEQNL